MLAENNSFDPYKSPQSGGSANRAPDAAFVACWIVVAVIGTCGVFTVAWYIITFSLMFLLGGDDARGRGFYPGLYAMPVAAIPTFFAGWFLVRCALRRKYIWILVTLVVTMPMLMWFVGNLIRYGF